MDIRTLHETGDTETLGQLSELLESASTRVEREIVELTIDALGPRSGVALGSLRLLIDDYLPWLERRSVHRARASGTSWAGIARLLGRSRQSIHERFVRPVSASDVLPPPPLRSSDSDAIDRRDATRTRRQMADADGADVDGGIVPW